MLKISHFLAVTCERLSSFNSFGKVFTRFTFVVTVTGCGSKLLLFVVGANLRLLRALEERDCSLMKSSGLSGMGLK